MFSHSAHAIEIIAYYDEIELCNPLGSHTKVHKQGCLLFTIINIHPKYRSQLKTMFLVSLAKVCVISKHGIDKVLEPFVEEMKTLHAHKLTHSIDSQNTVYDVGLLAFLADNLAAHQVGGFKESMSFAYRICRTCMATTEQTQTIFTESELELRNPQKHAEQCSDLELPNASEFSKIHGINRIINTFQTFQWLKICHMI